MQITVNVAGLDLDSVIALQRRAPHELRGYPASYGRTKPPAAGTEPA